MIKIINLLLLTFFLFSIIWSGCSKNFSPFKVVHSDNNTQECIFKEQEDAMKTGKITMRIKQNSIVNVQYQSRKTM